MAKVGTSNQDRTISLKAAVRSGINNKQQDPENIPYPGEHTKAKEAVGI